MAVGMDAVNIVPWPIQYVITNHHEDIEQIRNSMIAKGHPDYKLISYAPAPGVDIVLEPRYSGPSGSSAIVGWTRELLGGPTREWLEDIR
jgi:hypothetical protein